MSAPKHLPRTFCTYGANTWRSRPALLVTNKKARGRVISRTCTRNMINWDMLYCIVSVRHFFFFFFFFYSHSTYFPASSGQAVVTGVDPSPPRFLPSIFLAHRVQQSHCSSIFHRVLLLLTHALALSASQFVHKKKSQRIYTSMHSAGLELTKLTCTRLEDNLIRHRGDRLYDIPGTRYQK